MSFPSTELHEARQVTLRFLQEWSEALAGQVEGAPLHLAVEWDAAGEGDVQIWRAGGGGDRLAVVALDYQWKGHLFGRTAVCLHSHDLAMAGKVAAGDGDDLIADPGAELLAARLVNRAASAMAPGERTERFVTAVGRRLGRLEVELEGGDPNLLRIGALAAPLLRLDQAWADGGPLLATAARIIRDCVDDLILAGVYSQTPKLTLGDVALAVTGLAELTAHPERYLVEGELPRWPYVRFFVSEGHLLQVKVEDYLGEEDKESPVRRSFFHIIEAGPVHRITLAIQSRYPQLPGPTATGLALAQYHLEREEPLAFFASVQWALEPVLRKILESRMRSLGILKHEAKPTLGTYLSYLERPEGGDLLGASQGKFCEGWRQFVRSRNRVIHGDWYEPTTQEMLQTWAFLQSPLGLDLIASLG